MLATADQSRRGIQLLIDADELTYERLPMLEIVFDRLERIFSASLRGLTTQNIDVRIERIMAKRFGDYLDDVTLPAMLGVFSAVEWDNFGLISFDQALIYTMVDLLLGARRSAVAAAAETRPYTMIETVLIERMIRLVLTDLTAAFAPVTAISLPLERIETNPRFAAIARPSNACVIIRTTVGIGDRRGIIEFLFPYATLEPVRELLLQMFMGEKFGRDAIWENHLNREMRQTSIQLDAVLSEQSASLQDVMGWQVGSLLLLNARPDDEVTLRCGSVPILRGKMGRQGESLAVRVEEQVGQATQTHDA